jgi:hypothetical protein
VVIGSTTANSSFILSAVAANSGNGGKKLALSDVEIKLKNQNRANSSSSAHEMILAFGRRVRSAKAGYCFRSRLDFKGPDIATKSCRSRLTALICYDTACGSTSINGLLSHTHRH